MVTSTSSEVSALAKMQTRRQGVKAPLKKTYELSSSPENGNCSYDDKENAVNEAKPGRTSKRKSSGKAHEGKKVPTKKQKTERTSQDSPPIFEFKTGKSSFSKRKTLSLQKQREEEEKNKKQIDDLIAYFKNLDEQKLETV